MKRRCQRHQPPKFQNHEFKLILHSIIENFFFVDLQQQYHQLRNKAHFGYTINQISNIIIDCQVNYISNEKERPNTLERHTKFVYFVDYTV